MRLSLSARISITVLGLISIGGAASAYLVYTRSTGSLKQSIGSSQSQLADQSMDKIDRFLYERLVDVQELSDQTLLQQYAGRSTVRTPAASAQLDRLLNHYRILGGAWENVSLVDTRGSIVTSTDAVPAISQLQKQPQFVAAYQKALGGEPVYSDLFHESAEDESIMLFMAPLRDTTNPEQPLVGVVVGELAWPSTLEILQGIKGSQAYLLNKQGMVIGDTTDRSGSQILRQNDAKAVAFQRATQNRQGTGLLPSITASGKKQASFVTSYMQEGGYLDYHGNGWVLILQAPTSLAFAPVAQLTKSLIIIFVVILLFSAAVFLLLLDRQIKRPISQLLQAVTKLAKGDFSSRLYLKTHDELGELAGAFNNMADKLESAYKDLRATVTTMQKERNLLQAILDKLPVGVYVAKAPTSEPIMINGVGMRLLGIDPKASPEGPGESYDIIKEDGTHYPEDELPLVITLRTGRTVVKDDLIARRKDGTTGALRVISAPIADADGMIDSVVAVFEDITQERELERSREEFFSIASHELRTPLTAIRGNASLIQRYLWKQIDDKNVREMITDIHDSAVRLTDIVNDFLDTSRLEQRRMKFAYEPVAMVELARSVVKEYQAAGEASKTTLKIVEPAEPLPLAWVDRNRTKQILINLVGNSLKFTPAGNVTVSFSVDGGYVKTIVSDTGQGMPPEAQKRIFKKFEQSGETVLTRDSVRGTGLGLYISKLIVDQMHGHIQLETSEVGKGTVFSFSLPVVPNTSMPEDTQTITKN